jgi:hypothetical protein
VSDVLHIAAPVKEQNNRVGPGGGLDAVEKRETPCVCNSWPVQPVAWHHTELSEKLLSGDMLKLVVCILLRVLGQVQGFRLTQHWFEYFIQ